MRLEAGESLRRRIPLQEITPYTPIELGEAKQVCFYIDFLGSKQAVKNWNAQQLEKLIRLLGDMASLQGDFSMETEKVEHGSQPSSGQRSVLFLIM
jgi:hypothetical protein